MNQAGIVNSVSLFIGLAMLPLALYFWRIAISAMARQVAFDIRHELFVAAYRARACDDPAYREVRSLLNGFIRWSRWANGIRLASVLVDRRLSGSVNAPITSELIEGSAIPEELEQALKRFGRVAMLHTSSSTPSGLILMLVVISTRQIRQASKSIQSYLQRLGTETEDQDDNHFWTNTFSDGQIRPT